MMSIRAVKATTAKSTPNQMGPRIKNTIAPTTPAISPKLASTNRKVKAL
jgi:hypothetical protein